MKQEQRDAVKTIQVDSPSSNVANGLFVSALIILVPYTTPSLTYIMNIREPCFDKSSSKIYDQTSVFSQNTFPISELKAILLNKFF